VTQMRRLTGGPPQPGLEALMTLSTSDSHTGARQLSLPLPLH
jgi:hypothetical protein